jgi:hypothetical protein
VAVLARGLFASSSIASDATMAHGTIEQIFRGAIAALTESNQPVRPKLKMVRP